MAIDKANAHLSVFPNAPGGIKAGTGWLRGWLGGGSQEHKNRGTGSGVRFFLLEITKKKILQNLNLTGGIRGLGGRG